MVLINPFIYGTCSWWKERSSKMTCICRSVMVVCTDKLNWAADPVRISAQVKTQDFLGARAKRFLINNSFTIPNPLEGWYYHTHEVTGAYSVSLSDLSQGACGWMQIYTVSHRHSGFSFSHTHSPDVCLRAE